MKRILLLSLIIFCFPAFVLPPKAPIIEASLETLPTDVKREILRLLPHAGTVLNIPALAQGITTLAATSKTFYAAINNPQTVLIILQTLPKAGAKLLAEGLQKMPGMQTKEVQDWLKSIALEDGQSLYDAVRDVNSKPENIAKILENPNINVNWKTRYGRTALMEASRLGNSEIAKLLLSAGADVNVRDNYGLSSLLIASTEGREDIVKLLLEAGADANTKDANGRTPLMAASTRGHMHIINRLLAAGAGVNAKGDDDMTALMFASLSGNKEIVKRLIDAGANVNAKNKEGETALALIIIGRINMEIVKLLIDSGADVLITDNNARTALTRAKKQGNAALIKLLEDAEKKQKRE